MISRNPSMTWGEPIATWTWSTNVVQVDFTNLAPYRELLLTGFALTTDTAGTDYLALRTSTDNGATFAATGYDTFSTSVSPTTQWSLYVAQANTVAVAFRAELLEFNVASIPTECFMLAGGRNSTIVANRSGDVTAGLNNALRVFTAGGANITGGRLRLRGRRG
mgnify:CR=1 FL=1